MLSQLQGTDDGEKKVKVGGYVPVSLHRAFMETFPQQGMLVWTIRAAMEAMLQIHNEEPSLDVKLMKALRGRLAALPDDALLSMLRVQDDDPMEDEDERVG